MQWKRAGLLSCYLFSLARVRIQQETFYFIFDIFIVFLCVLFVAFFVFFGCLVFVVDFYVVVFLNINCNQQINITRKFQDALCPSLAVSVLSSSVEQPSQSLAVAVSSSLDVTVISKRSIWSSTAMSVA